MNFDDAADKDARRAALTESIVAGQQPEPAGDARAELEALLSSETLAELDRRMLALVSGEVEPEPEPFFDSVAAAKAARERTVVDAVLGRSAAQGATAGSGSFDGGARQTPQRPETHEQTLTRLLRGGGANAGRDL